MRRSPVATARIALAAVTTTTLVGIASNAAAQSNPPDGDHELYAPYERRGGFMIGTIVGPAFGTASGNPKGQSYRFNPAYESKLGFAYGYRCTPFLGGALTDWFTVGVGLSFGTIQTRADHDSQITTFLFHFEAFPLYAKGGPWRDVGVAADFGAGASTIHNTSTGEELAHSGVASAAGLGVFWEPWRVWHLAAGPSVSYQRNWSQWYERNDVLVGIRGMFYGAP
jgi:hypothetical protein